MPTTPPLWPFLERYLRPHWRRTLLLACLVFATLGLDLSNPQILRAFIDSVGPVVYVVWFRRGSLHDPSRRRILLGAYFDAPALRARRRLIDVQSRQLRCSGFSDPKLFRSAYDFS